VDDLSDPLAKLQLRHDERLKYEDSENVHGSLNTWYPSPPEKAWEYNWLRLVEDYTSRHLTREDDNLPALAGVAKFIHRATSSTYLAGHWRSSILETLCWKVDVLEPDYVCSDTEHDALLLLLVKSDF
jgi:hypothetical protein